MCVKGGSIPMNIVHKKGVCAHTWRINEWKFSITVPEVKEIR